MAFAMVGGRRACYPAPMRTSLLLLVLVSSPTIVHAAPGDLDPSFDGDGVVTTSIPGATTALPSSMGLQPDGKLGVAVAIGNGGTGAVPVLRYRAAGALAPDFEGDGIVSTPVGFAA